MNLNTLRHIKLLRGGEIRAWALHITSIIGLCRDVADLEHEYLQGHTFLGIPVAVVPSKIPEGVIV